MNQNIAQPSTKRHNLSRILTCILLALLCAGIARAGYVVFSHSIHQSRMLQLDNDCKRAHKLEKLSALQDLSTIDLETMLKSHLWSSSTTMIIWFYSADSQVYAREADIIGDVLVYWHGKITVVRTPAANSSKNIKVAIIAPHRIGNTKAKNAWSSHKSMPTFHELNTLLSTTSTTP